MVKAGNWKQGVIATDFHKRKEVVWYDDIRSHIFIDIVFYVGCILNLLTYCHNQDNSRTKKVITLFAAGWLLIYNRLLAITSLHDPITCFYYNQKYSICKHFFADQSWRGSPTLEYRSKILPQGIHKYGFPWQPMSWCLSIRPRPCVSPRYTQLAAR